MVRSSFLGSAHSVTAPPRWVKNSYGRWWDFGGENRRRVRTRFAFLLVVDAAAWSCRKWSSGGRGKNKVAYRTRSTVWGGFFFSLFAFLPKEEGGRGMRKGQQKPSLLFCCFSLLSFRTFESVKGEKNERAIFRDLFTLVYFFCVCVSVCTKEENKSGRSNAIRRAS